jgi:hypothetical protein
MLYTYAKNAREDLTKTQLQRLSALVKKEFI